MCERCKTIQDDPRSRFWGIFGHETPFVGRTAGLRALESAFERALRYASPQGVTLMGAQGVGKSRMAAELIQRLKQHAPNVRVFFGIARPGSDPIGQVLRERFALGTANDDAARDKLRQEVTRVFHDRRVTEMLHFLGSFVGLRFPENPFINTVEDDPAQFNQIAKSVIRRFLEADASESPIALVLDDLHLAASETLDVLKFLHAELEGAPIVMLCLARPALLERRGDWFDGEGDHLRIDLGPLESAPARELAAAMLSRAETRPDELIEEMVDMTAGNPFHMEQAVRVFAEAGAIDVSGERWQIDLDRALEVPFPMSVEEAVQARLDSLTPEARDFLKKAACVGNVFWVGAVRVLARSDQELNDDPNLWIDDEQGDVLTAVLDEILEADYVLEMPDSSIPMERELVFKHNLEKDLAYRQLGEGQRKRYHLILAQWLESRVRETTEEQLEYIANNFHKGAVPERAARYWLAAGDRARKRYANDRAVELYLRGLDQLGRGDSARRMEALHALGGVLALKGDTEGARESFAGMLRVAYTLDLSAKAGAAHNRLGRIARDTGDYDVAMIHLRRGMDLFRNVGDRRGVGSSLDDVGKLFWLRGAYSEALETMREGLELRRELADPRSVALSLNNLGLVFHDKGDYRQALDHHTKALEMRRNAKDVPGIITSLNNMGVIYQDLGEHGRAIALWQEGIDACEQIGDRRSLATLLNNTGEACKKLGRLEEAHEALHRAIQIGQVLGDRLLLCDAYRNLGEVFLELGDVRMAADYCGKAMKQAERLGSQVNVGIVSRALGEIGAASALKEGAGATELVKKTKEYFERAIEVLSDAGNEKELARSMTGYGKFLSELGDKHRGERLQARAEELYERFRRSVGEGVPS